MQIDLALPRLETKLLKRSARATAFLFVLALATTSFAQAATAFIEGEAIYLERIMPPPDATLVVTLQDASRAGAPAIEHASTSLRLGSGPPYAWKLVYDASLPNVERLTVRARITTPAGLWMTTDTLVSALGGPSPLRLRLVSVTPPPAQPVATVPAMPASTPSADLCASAATQAAMNLCAQEDFEEAGSGYAQAYQALSKPWPTAQRDKLRRMQSAWLKFRTEACRFESGPTAGGSAQGFVYWRCAARMTRERTLAMQAMATCREGDITCTRRVP